MADAEDARAKIEVAACSAAQQHAESLGATIEPDVVRALAALTGDYAAQLARETRHFARHRKGATVTAEDVLLCARKLPTVAAALRARLAAGARGAGSAAAKGTKKRKTAAKAAERPAAAEGGWGGDDSDSDGGPVDLT